MAALLHSFLSQNVHTLTPQFVYDESQTGDIEFWYEQLPYQSKDRELSGGRYQVWAKRQAQAAVASLQSTFLQRFCCLSGLGPLLMALQLLAWLVAFMSTCLLTQLTRPVAVVNGLLSQTVVSLTVNRHLLLTAKRLQRRFSQQWEIFSQDNNLFPKQGHSSASLASASLGVQTVSNSFSAN